MDRVFSYTRYRYVGSRYLRIRFFGASFLGFCNEAVSYWGSMDEAADEARETSENSLFVSSDIPGGETSSAFARR